MPIISPVFAMKRLQQCDPGELIWVTVSKNDILALVTKIHGHKALICLRGDEVHRKPFYVGIELDQTVLSYGQEFRLELDPASRQMRSENAMLVCGAVIAHLDGLVLHVGHNHGLPPRYYNWNTGLTGDEQPAISHCAVYTRWAIRVEGAETFSLNALASSDF